MDPNSIFNTLQTHPQYLLMPLIAGLVGYITKLLALEMMFRPVEFMGLKPPYLGWQGVVPRKAPKMAAAATHLLMGRILHLEELARRLDPARIIKELEGPLHQAVDILVREIGDQYIGMAWRALPGLIQQKIIGRAHSDLPAVAQEVWKEVCKNPEKYIDVQHLLVSNLVKDKILLNDIFRKMGRKEFAFFRSAGFWFGVALGFVQLACWLAWQNPMLIPVFGGLVGLVTDWLALQMLFRPLNPVTVFGITFQGKFIARQKEVARDYASLIARELLTPSNLIEEILRGPCADHVIQLVKKHIELGLNEQFGKAKPLATFVLGDARIEQIKSHTLKRVIDAIPHSTEQIEKYALDALDVHNTIVNRMDLLTPQEFEGLLRPAFKEDEKILVLAGAALGFLIGELQVHLML